MVSTRTVLKLCSIGLVIGGLLAGCTLPAAPDVTPTPSEQEAYQEQMAQMATQVAQEAATATVPPQPSPTPFPTPTLVPTPVPSPTFTPVPTIEPSPQPTEAPPAPTEQVYVVKRGDTLFSIARRFGVGLSDLAAYNGIVNPNRIYAGQVLRIPAGAPMQSSTGTEAVYIVQPGDRLFRIALRYNMNYLYLAAYNGISNPNLIYPGQVIRIPPSP